MKIAFFDRDGTISLDYPDDEWSHIDTPILMPYAIEAMQHVIKIGYKIVILTNQYIIGEGFITQEQYESYNKKLLSLLKEKDIDILDVFYCPHKRADNCTCCKPRTGMIDNALKKHPQIDLADSFIVGDSLCDMQLAKNMNIKSYGIKQDFAYKKHQKIENLKELKEKLIHM